jgi:hypothetical protein
MKKRTMMIYSQACKKVSVRLENADKKRSSSGTSYRYIIMRRSSRSLPTLISCP